SRKSGLVRLGDVCEGVLLCRAVQWMLLARAALIDEDDVACALDSAEQVANLPGELGGSLARTTGEKDQRVGRLGPDGREYRDEQRDLPALLGVPILENGQCAAIGIDGSLAARTWMQAVERTSGWRAHAPDCARDRQDSEQQQVQQRGSWPRSKPRLSFFRPIYAHNGRVSLVRSLISG